MPTISVFFGITVYMYAFDHGEPHIHAEYAEWEASLSIQTGDLIAGRLPIRAAKLVSEWIGMHRPPHWVEPLS